MKVLLACATMLAGALALVAPFGGWLVFTRFLPMSQDDVVTTMAGSLFIFCFLGSELIRLSHTESKNVRYCRPLSANLQFRLEMCDEHRTKEYRQLRMYMLIAAGFIVCGGGMFYLATTQPYILFYWLGVASWLLSLNLMAAYVIHAMHAERTYRRDFLTCPA